MTGNRFPNIPKGLHETHWKTPKAILMETLFDISELHGETEKQRMDWIKDQIICTTNANKRGK